MQRIYKSLLLLSLMLLPGCGRIIDWGKSNFYQGEDLNSLVDEVKPFIRSAAIYDQLETKAIFDVLWLSDAVRTTYAQLQTMRHGYNEEKFQAILRRQLEENNHYITFYVLSIHEVKLAIPEAAWSFFLRIDGKEYLPFEVKEIELPYEYQVFFGKRWNRFKVPYVIRFGTDSEEENPLLAEGSKQITLVARSAQKEHAFIWLLAPENELVLPQEPSRTHRRSADEQSSELINKELK